MAESIARLAVDETMRAKETEMQCKGGLQKDRRTGEMLYSKFFHRDSRPINGLSDPHWQLLEGIGKPSFDGLPPINGSPMALHRPHYR